MPLSLLSAFDPYVRASISARRDQAKPARYEPFVIESVLQKPQGGKGNFSDASRDEDAPEHEDASAFDQAFAAAYALPPVEEESDATMPEDAYDAQGLCALLEAAAGG